MAILVQLMPMPIFKVSIIAHKSKMFLLDMRRNSRKSRQGDSRNRGLCSATLPHCYLWQPQSPFSQVPKELRIPNLNHSPDIQPPDNQLPDNQSLNNQSVGKQAPDKQPPNHQLLNHQPLNHQPLHHQSPNHRPLDNQPPDRWLQSQRPAKSLTFIRTRRSRRTMCLIILGSSLAETMMKTLSFAILSP